MKIDFIVVGKTNDAHIAAINDDYISRLKHYIPFEFRIIPSLKQSGQLNEQQLRTQEGAAILKTIRTDDYLILLDDKGTTYTSLAFARRIEKMSHVHKQIVFVVGGAFGFSQEVYERANAMLSLSSMTFSHQIIRPIFTEQLYRAMTIIKNESYHHEGSLLDK